MFSSFFSSKERTNVSSKGGKRAARNARLRKYYGDPLPFPAPPPPFNLFSPSTYTSLLTPLPKPEPHVGIWSPETESVNISNDAQTVEIWRRGMWGKGTLSRSSPAWRQRKTKEMTGGREVSLEELTALKRKERAEFKEERLKRERMERERQLQKEASGEPVAEETQEELGGEAQTKRKRQKVQLPDDQELPVYSEEYLDKEILQIAPDEALFLMLVGLLVVEFEGRRLSLSEFLHFAGRTSRPDDPFLVKFVVYYHYRRQQIIVKTGLKFGVEYLLYDRPIPMAHAGHCVNVLGDYHLWGNDSDRECQIRQKVTWQEINLWQRLMGNVKKRLKLVYVEIPPVNSSDTPDWRRTDSVEGFLKVLQSYRLREVMTHRMVIARERDAKEK